MKKLYLIALLPLCGCTAIQGAYNTLTSTSATEQNSAAAAENLYTASVTLMTAYVKTGKATPGQISAMTTIEANAYQEVLAARQAVANKDSAALAVAEKALMQYENSMKAVTP